MAGKWVKVSGLALAVSALGGALIAYASNIPEGATYVGVSKCRLCHMDQYNTWNETGMAHAFDALKGDEQKNADCLKCHVTGYGKPGGFKDVDSTPGMENIQCEECHGPGSAHVEAAARNLGSEGAWEKHINKVPENACIGCHNPHINFKKRAEELRAKAGA
jgi:hypothetical protein